MNIEEYEKIQEKIILIIERYKFFEKNEISKINFDIEDCSVFKECIMSLRYLIQEDKKVPIMENKQYKILKKYFLNFNEKDFKVLNYDIHSYINYDNKREWLQTGYPILGRWTDYYLLGVGCRKFTFNIIKSKSNLIENQNIYPYVSKEPYLIIDLIPSKKYYEIMKCGGYEITYNLGKSNKLLLNKKIFLKLFNFTENSVSSLIFEQSFPIWGKLTTNDEVFTNIIDFISKLAKLNKNVISEYEIIKKDKKIIKKINEPVFENIDEFVSIDGKDININEIDYTFVKEIDVGDHKYTIVETKEETFSKLKRSDSTEIYSKLFDKVWMKNSN